MVVNISGSDPYLTGPRRDYPPAAPLWVRLRLLSEAGGGGQIFFFQTIATEANSVRFTVPAGQWVEGRMPLPALGTGYRMRIDPPGTSGKAVLDSLRFELRSALPDFDFGTVPDAMDWQAAHDIGSLEPSLEGLRVELGGGDPYLFGPARDYPADKLLWLRVRLRSEAGGTCQVFYFTAGPTEENSVRFNVPPGDWHEAQVPLPALGAGYRLRIDPPGASGSCLLGRMWFEERVIYAAPVWPKPQAPALGSDAVVVEAGDLRLLHNRTAVGGFEVRVGEQKMAIGNSQAMIGYLAGQAIRWIPCGNFGAGSVSVEPAGPAVVVTAAGDDPDGARWNLAQRFTPAAAGGIEIETTVSVNQDRALLYLPPLTLLAGIDAFGTNKSQALLAGVEYLENEASSSEADLRAPASWRLVPDTVKITFPLMAIQAENRYIGLVWEPQPRLGAVFDSPDRQFHSGGHLFGLLFPGSDGVNREERSLLPYRAETLSANQPLRVRAWLIGGTGQSVIPAVQQYVALRGLPAVPSPGYAAAEYFELAAHGWLDSKIRESNLYRHAYWPGFGAQPASDAALWMRWLAEHVGDPNLKSRLTNAAAAALAQVAPQNYNASQIGHVRYPAPALVFGALPENVSRARSQGQALLGRFEPDGSVLYVPPTGGTDYGATHWAPDANGLTAGVVANLLESAAFSGDPTLLSEGIRRLRAMDKFRDSVPRGAQTWEIPLHTPDILASGYLVRAYTLGYELTGDRALLEQAKYWAWTGVPFVYLHPPTSGPVGLYNTIPVLGATGWVAPVWLGLPVQWCGLVYGDALYRFAAHDPTGPWRQIADGIAVGGIQHSWPSTDAERQGLLPDFFQLHPQLRDGPAINPATVQASAVRFFGSPPAYDFRVFLRHELRVHAPGAVGDVVERKDGVMFTVAPWTSGASRVLVNGFRSAPQVLINNRATPLVAPHNYQAADGRLILELTQPSTIELRYPASAALEVRPAGTGTLELAWPTRVTNAVVEACPQLSDQAVWTVSDAPVRQESGWFVMPHDAPNDQQYFRLRVVTGAGSYSNVGQASFVTTN